MRELFFWFCEWGFVKAFALLPKEGGGSSYRCCTTAA
jgi:hypothetical protein